MRLILLVFVWCAANGGFMMAQGVKMVPAPKQGGSHGYCLYSQGTGPVDSPLMVAIWRGDIQAVSRLMAAEHDLNRTFTIPCNDGGDDLKTTPLLNAIKGGHAEMVQFLLEHGANPLFRTSPGGSALLAAATLGNVLIVRLLLQHGALVDDAGRDGETPLLRSAERPNNIAVIKELVAMKADIHAVTEDGDNAVMLAAGEHRADAVKFLVDLGVDACAKNYDGETAIDQAKSNLNEDPGKQEIIAFLQEKCGRQ